MVSAAHFPARHSAALRKLGVVQQQQHSVAFVNADECLDQAAQLQVHQPQQEASATTPADRVLTPATQQEYEEPIQCQLQQLLQRVTAAAQKLLTPLVQHEQQQRQHQEGPAGSLQASGSLTLLLDSLTALHSLFPRQQALPAFLHCCRVLGGSLRLANYRFVALAASDIPGEASLLAALQHSADAVLSLAPVEGRTAELDGRLDVVLRRLPCSNHGSECGSMAEGGPILGSSTILPGVQSWHFRAGEVAVRWLPGRIDGRELMV